MTQLAARFATASASAVLVAACCSAPLDSRQFAQVGMAEQLRMLEAANNRGCLEYRATFLALLSDHGLDAALAMVQYLDVPHKEFPQEDAVLVLLYVSLKGTSLRDTEVVPALERIVSRNDSALLRRDAQRVLAEIARERR